MLSFFRKYQKIIFIFTTAVIIASFSFFGTLSSIGGAPQSQEKLLVKAIDGSSITLQKVERMALFLGSSLLDLKDDKASFINVLNDGVLEKDFLQTSLGPLLAEKIFPEMQEELLGILEKASSFHSYRHPTLPILSAESAWEQFAPESLKISSELLQKKTADLRKFDLLCKAYLKHQEMPSRFLKKILAYQEEQAGKGQSDPGLSYADLSLFGLHTAKEFLGDVYIKAASQFILNGAAFAKRQGLKVSLGEARDELVSHLKEAIEMTGSQLDQSLYQTFLLQVRRLGMTEAECLDIWRDIALFRKAVSLASDKVAVANDIVEEFQKSHKKQALVETFSLPSHLQIRDFATLMKLQLYIESVSAVKEKAFVLPTQFLPISEIEKKSGNLVQKEYTLECAELDIKKAASQISLKETWSWQTEDQNFALLKKQFSFLQKAEAKTKEERFAALEKLEAKERNEVDRFSREQILSQDIVKIKSILSALPVEVKSLSLSLQGTELPFKGVKNPKALMTLLETSCLKGETTQDPSLLLAAEKLSFYTDNGQHYYSIAVVERSPVKKLQTFAEANASGTLRALLEKRLETAYADIRKKDSLPYLQKDGSWKPLSEVKEKIGLIVFAPAFREIAEEYKKNYGVEISDQQKNSAEFYVQNWMLPFMKQQLQLAKNGSFEKKESALENQWSLVQEKKTVQKNEEIFKAPDLFELPEGEWSSLVHFQGGKALFFKMMQKLDLAPLSTKEIEELKAPLKEEAHKKLFIQILDEIEAKKAICLKDSL